MKTQFIAFLSIVIPVYSLANYYIALRFIQSFTFSGSLKILAILAITLPATSFIVGMMIDRSHSSILSEMLLKVGNTWLVILLYALILVAFIDFIRLLDYFFQFLPPFTYSNKRILGFIVIGIIGIIGIIGYLKAQNTRIVRIPITINKQIDEVKNFKIVAVSDIHFGSMIGKEMEEKLVALISNENPDLAVFCGDMIDGNIGPVLRKKIGSHLISLKPKYGVYGVTGNHEYIGDIRASLAFLDSVNITIIKDSVVVLPNGFQIVGRNDRSMSLMDGKPQKPLQTIMNGKIDSSKPIIVLNHQPYNLEESEQADADLHISGHTHNGQMFPFNLITNAIFELDWGYIKKNNTHYYISSGFGSWGPRFRLGSQSEIIVFDITCK